MAASGAQKVIGSQPCVPAGWHVGAQGGHGTHISLLGAQLGIHGLDLYPLRAPNYLKEENGSEIFWKKRKDDNKMKKYQCTICGYVYDPVQGDPDSGIAPGTAFKDIPDDWVCPVCGVAKDQFEAVE